VLPPGTITSWNMPEDKLIFQGDKAALIQKLSGKISRDQLISESKFIEILIPFSESKT